MSAGQLVALLALVVLIAGALLLFVPTQRSHPSSGPIDRDDDRYWLGGMVYYNPDDPEWLVPKRYGLGRTLNLGHPVGRLIMGGLLLLAVALAIVSVLVPGFSSYGCHPLTGCHF
jgi:uncharacterized membrane protein